MWTIWVVRTCRNKVPLHPALRQITIRDVREYRTVSGEAAVLARVLPLDLLAKERAVMYTRCSILRQENSSRGSSSPEASGPMVRVE